MYFFIKSQTVYGEKIFDSNIFHRKLQNCIFSQFNLPFTWFELKYWGRATKYCDLCYYYYPLHVVEYWCKLLSTKKPLVNHQNHFPSNAKILKIWIHAPMQAKGTNKVQNVSLSYTKRKNAVLILEPSKGKVNMAVSNPALFMAPSKMARERFWHGAWFQVPQLINCFQFTTNFLCMNNMSPKFLIGRIMQNTGKLNHCKETRYFV